MSVSPFLRQFGFALDPFESTNAEREPNLSEYFVPPPYFPTIMGDSSDPKSQIIFAPRGGGKTAQRRMIERRSATEDGFLCITYDEFDQPSGFRIENVDLNYHLAHVCRLILTGVLIQLDGYPLLAESLSKSEKVLLKFQLDKFLGSLSASEFERACASLKNFGDRAADFWKKWGKPISVIIAIVSKAAGFDTSIDADSLVSGVRKEDETMTFHLNSLTRIVRKLGFSATYVLVDKVDEIAATNNSAAAAFSLIRPLLVDLPTLETPLLAFKFFLWDKIGAEYRQHGSRPDRVPIYNLTWSVDELNQMLSARLRVYSHQAVTSFNELLAPDVEIDVQRLATYFALGSPRDMIRVAKRILAEQTRTREDAKGISKHAIYAGLANFSEERTTEIFGPDRLADMRRIARPTFSISQIASDVFRVSNQAARAKVQGWQDSGLISKIGEIPNPPNRPSYLFGISDLRAAVAMLSTTPIEHVLDSVIIQCPNCQGLCCNDRDEVDCPHCSAQFHRNQAQSLKTLCAIEQSV